MATPPRRNFVELAKWTWLRFDRRSLGLARIAIGLTLLFDLVRRSIDLETWYTNLGLIPNWFVLQRPPREPSFSLMAWVSKPSEAVFFFALTGFVYLVFLVGYRTRLFHVLTLVMMTSVHSRVMQIQNGGDRMLGILLVWTLFLPMGDRLSVDAVLRSLRLRRETHGAELADRAAVEPDRTPFESVAVLAVIVQLFFAYLLSAVQKNGPVWKEGLALYYVFHASRMAGSVACALNPYLSSFAFVVMAKAALAVEFTAPFLIVTPFWRKWARRVAIGFLLGLHLGIGATMAVAPFGATMCAYFPMLLGGEDWAALERFFARRDRPRDVYFLGASPIAFELARLLARLDRFERLAFASSADPDHVPDAVAALLPKARLVVVDPDSGRRWTDAAAVTEIAASLPLGLLYAWILGPLFGLALGMAFNREEELARWFGLRREGEPPIEERPRVSPAWVPRAMRWVRDGACVFLMAVSTHQLLLENEVFPAWLKVKEPYAIHAVVSYPQLYQLWNMFAPGVAREARTIFVDAVTVDGRHVDPLNEAGTKPMTWEGLPEDHMPRCISQDSLWEHYFRDLEKRPAAFPTLRDWLVRYPQRTGRANDRLVRFDVYAAREAIPPPGRARQPLELVKFYSWSADDAHTSEPTAAPRTE